MGDLNINILNCDLNKDTADFVDVIYASLLYPTINTPTGIITGIIDNIFYNDFTKTIYSWKHSYSISDRLTHFFIFIDLTRNFDNSREKEVPKIRKFNKENLLADLTQIDWNNCLKIY